MKTENKIYISLFAFLIIFLTSINTGNADSYYNILGLDNGYFQGNNTLASTTQGFLTSNYNTATRAMVSPFGTAEVSDLDNDGTNEIIAIDNGQIKLFNSKSLTPGLVYNIPVTDEYSNFINIDINSDGKREVIFAAKENQRIYFIQYNGTSFTNLSSISYSALGAGGGIQNKGDIIIKCGGIDNCLGVVVRNNTITPVSSPNKLIAFIFNSSGVFNNLTIDATNANDKGYCFSQIPEIQYIDYDGDGVMNYVFSDAILTAGSDIIQVNYVHNSASGLILNRQINNTLGVTFPFSAGTKPCRVNYSTSGTPIGGYFTSPMVFPFQDTDPNNGMETLIALATSDDEFRMKAYKPTGTTEAVAYLDQFPSTQQADGMIMSNIMRANAMPINKGAVINPKTEACVMGYQKAINQIDLLCGSELYHFSGTIQNFNNVEYFFENLTFNVTQAYGQRNVMIHSIMSKTDTIEGNNMDEVLTPYGIFELENTDFSALSCGLSSQCELNRIFQNPKGDGAIIPVDVEKVGYDDLLLMTATNLWYIDDGYSNTAPYISEYSINPCLNSVWQQNTSVSITIMPIDIDPSDLVSVRAILYYGSVNAIDSGWSANFTSGTTIPITFIANTTATSATLRLMATDTNNFNGHNVITDLSFSVGLTGVNNGDCQTDFTASASTNTTGNYNLLADPENNAISGSLQTIDEASGFGLGVTIWYLIFMVIIGAGAIAFTIEQLSRHKIVGGSVVVALVAIVFIFVEAILALIGFSLRILGAGSAAILVMFFVVGIVMVVRNAMTPKSTGN